METGPHKPYSFKIKGWWNLALNAILPCKRIFFFTQNVFNDLHLVAEKKNPFSGIMQTAKNKKERKQNDMMSDIRNNSPQLDFVNRFRQMYLVLVSFPNEPTRQKSFWLFLTSEKQNINIALILFLSMIAFQAFSHAFMSDIKILYILKIECWR